MVALFVSWPCCCCIGYCPSLPRFWQVWAFPLVLGSLVRDLVLRCGGNGEPLRERVFSIFADSKDSSNNFRLNVWASVQNDDSGPPLDWGSVQGNNAFNKIYPLYQRANYSALSAYSIYLELLVEVGVIGLSTCFVWLLVVLLRQGWEQLQRLRAQQSQRDIFWLMAAIVHCLWHAGPWGGGHSLVSP